jgi:hypothetical protein
MAVVRLTDRLIAKGSAAIEKKMGPNADIVFDVYLDSMVALCPDHRDHDGAEEDETFSVTVAHFVLGLDCCEAHRMKDEWMIDVRFLWEDDDERWVQHLEERLDGLVLERTETHLMPDVEVGSEGEAG